MRWLRALPMGVLSLALLGTGAAVLRGPATAGRRLVSGPGHRTWAAAHEPVRDPFTTLLLAGSALLLAVACCWLAVAVTACTWDALRGGDVLGGRSSPGGGRDLDADRGGSSFLRPPLVRALVAGCLGVGVLGPVPAHAQSTVEARPSMRATPAEADSRVPLARLLEGLPVPDRTVGRAVASPTTRTGDSAADHLGMTLEVDPGDSLWSLTARLLPDHVPVHTVVTGWHLLYAANRTAIGDDPDLLRPGLRLRVDRALTDLARSAARHSPTTATTSTDRRTP